MTSVKVKFRQSESREHEGNIYFQIIHNRVVRQWYSDYRIFCDEWDGRKSAIIIPSDSTRRKYLQSIREQITWDKERFIRIISEFTSRDSYTADDIIEEFINRKNRQSFFNFMKDVIARLKRLGKIRTSQTYSTALNSFCNFLRNFNGNEDIVFDGINSDLMESYQAHLEERGLIPNSISFHMRILRAAYHRAVEKGITDDRKPFRHVYTGIDKTTKRAVDVTTMKRIKEADFSKQPKAAYARDIFILSFYFRGMSFVDMAYLKKSDLSNGVITYRRRKTGQKLVVKWTKEMQEVLDRYPGNTTEYLLPIVTSASATPYSQYRSKQYQINKGLKTVAESIGLNMSLTLYCSRHSWASIAKSKGIPLGVISDGLGHDSELTTQIYLSTLDTTAVDKANALIMKLL